MIKIGSTTTVYRTWIPKGATQVVWQVWAHGAMLQYGFAITNRYQEVQLELE